MAGKDRLQPKNGRLALRIQRPLPALFDASPADAYSLNLTLISRSLCVFGARLVRRRNSTYIQTQLPEATLKNIHPILDAVDTHSDDLVALADRVWGTPELHYGEFASCAAQTETLRAKGFRVTENVAGIPTAVVGEAGEGGPVIAILGEYDALPGLSQVAGIAEPRPEKDGGNGHGCGHNLLGAAALLAACAVKDWLAATGTPGRVRY